LDIASTTIATCILVHLEMEKGFSTCSKMICGPFSFSKLVWTDCWVGCEWMFFVPLIPSYCLAFWVY
jgi:hypothetical protein